MPEKEYDSLVEPKRWRLDGKKKFSEGLKKAAFGPFSNVENEHNVIAQIVRGRNEEGKYNSTRLDMLVIPKNSDKRLSQVSVKELEAGLLDSFKPFGEVKVESKVLEDKHVFRVIPPKEVLKELEEVFQGDYEPFRKTSEKLQKR